MKEINEEVKKDISDSKSKVNNFIKNIDSKSQDLINSARSTFINFSISKIKYIINFEKFFLENIGDENKNLIDELYIEIINSTESLGNIFLQKGPFKWLISLFSNYNYLWNIVDMLTSTYLKKINKIINLLEVKFIEYISKIKKIINVRAKVSIRKFNEEQMKIFKELKSFYEKEKKEINEIKIKLYNKE